MEDKKLATTELLLTLYLIDYHRHSFSVRSRGLMTGAFDPQEVRELVNLILWRGNGMKGEDKVRHMNGLHGIIQNNTKELKVLVARVHAGNMSTPILEEINQLNRELEAADMLMGYVSDG